MVLLLLLGPVLLPEYRDPDAGRLDLPSAAAVAGRRARDDLRAEAHRRGRLRLLAGRCRSWRAWSSAGLFVRRQRTLADPLIDLRLFRVPRVQRRARRPTRSASSCAFGAFLFIAQYLQLVLGMSPLEAGLWTLPLLLAFIVGSMLAPASRAASARRMRDRGRLMLAAVGFGAARTGRRVGRPAVARDGVGHLCRSASRRCSRWRPT